MIVFGIDPGTGASSPLGYCRFNAETRDIYEVGTLTSRRYDAANRIHDISKQLHDVVSCPSYPPIDLMCIETTYLFGTGNNSYQQMVGGSIAAAPRGCKIVFVPNMTMKLKVGKHGSADKVGVAIGVLDYFEDSKIAHTATFNAEWDVTDALGVGIAGLEIYKNGR